MSALAVDRGWGDYWLTDKGLAPTHVTVEQVEAMSRLGIVEAGSSDVRFGDEFGDLLGVTADGKWWEIGMDGSTDDVSEVMG